MEDWKKFTAFIALFAIAAVLTEVIQRTLIGGKIDWRFLPTISPMLLVCLFFGFRTKDAKKLFIFPLAAALIIVLIDALEMLFGLKSYQKTARAFNNSLLVYFFGLFIIMAGASLFVVGLGKLLAYLSKIIFKKTVY